MPASTAQPGEGGIATASVEGLDLYSDLSGDHLDQHDRQAVKRRL